MEATVEEMQGSLVGSLMQIIAAPDDQEIARAAEELVRALDARMSAGT